MLVTVKAREIQRGMLAAMRQDQAAAVRHFLAAAHLELVLASDYAEAGRDDLAARSRISAASCLWRAGKVGQAREELEGVARDVPAPAAQVQAIILDLEGSRKPDLE